MTTAIFYTATTLNGFLADDEDSLEWLFAVPSDDAQSTGLERFMDGIGVLVEGSSTYRWVVEHEGLLDAPEKWQSFYGDRPTWVFTSREQPIVPGADVRFASGDVRDAWPAIRDAAGDRDVWVVGGGDLAAQFARAGLLDEIRASIAPATLVSGKPLFPMTLGSDRLTLVSAHVSGPFADLVYRLRA